MLKRLFIREDGTVSTDWVMLTALMLGTAFAVVNTVVRGVEGASHEEVIALRGVAVQRGFGARSCPEGVDGVQSLEDARVAEGGADRVDVAAWVSLARYRSDADVLAERDARVEALGEVADGDPWTRDRTLLAAVSCELVIRGLAD